MTRVSSFQWRLHRERTESCRTSWGWSWRGCGATPGFRPASWGIGNSSKTTDTKKNIWIKILIQIKIHNQIQIQVAGVPAERQRPVLPQCPRQNLRPQLQTHSTGKISKFVLEMLEITSEYFQRCNCCIRCSTGKPVHMMSYKTFKKKPDTYLSLSLYHRMCCGHA